EFRRVIFRSYRPDVGRLVLRELALLNRDLPVEPAWLVSKGSHCQRNHLGRCVEMVMNQETLNGHLVSHNGQQLLMFDVEQRHRKATFPRHSVDSLTRVGSRLRNGHPCRSAL